MADEVLRERRGISRSSHQSARGAQRHQWRRQPAMSSIMDELADDDDCWVVILTGSGDKAFSAGMDLKAFSSGEGRDIMGSAAGSAASPNGTSRSRSLPPPTARLWPGARDHAVV